MDLVDKDGLFLLLLFFWISFAVLGWGGWNQGLGHVRLVTLSLSYLPILIGF